MQGVRCRHDRPLLRPGRDYRPVTDEGLQRTAVYCMAVEAWSGKQKAVAPDFPGAYRYEALPREEPAG